MTGTGELNPAPSTPHGCGDDARSQRLRRRPPESALMWVERSLGVSIRGVRAYRGGITSAVHGLRIEGKGGVETVVLRRYVIEELAVEEPDLAAREARVLRLLDRCDVSTPGLLAVDPTGEDAGVPSVLMTRVAGRLDWAPTELDPWLHRMATVLPAIHKAPISLRDGVQRFVPYEPESWEPPTWLRDKRLWDRALDVFHGPRLDPDDVFIHRDFHPGNVLWGRGRVEGVVDWQSASIGPRSADVWHCRGNLLGRFGLPIADRFTDVWESISGHTYHPWSETVMLVDVVSWSDERTAQELRDLEDLLARRLAELGS
jgi:aminoglycoside phosphotransferase (APT) family kinase protein